MSALPLDLPDTTAAPRGGKHRSAHAEQLLADLNPQQRAAVVHEGGPLLVVAGAGSGKTRVLTRRIAYLLEARGVAPGEVLAITFTNKAAGEMKERVEHLVGGRARAMWVSTFHSACVRILRREAQKLGFTSTFTIYDAADSQRLMTQVIRDLDLDPKRNPPRALAAKISNLKNELIDFEDARSKAQSPEELLVADVFGNYQRRLQQANALDFDDLIGTAVALLQMFPDVAEHYRRRFRHVLVDEYQDTNHAQYVLVRELVGTDATAVPGAGGAAANEVPRGELCVVGDADQSIYAFRGASIRNIVEFETDYPDATVVLLEQNYRSTQTILSAANAVIAKNPDRVPKRLWTDAGDGAPIVGYVGDNEHDEAAFVAEEVDRLGDKEGLRPADVAVFYRTNAQSRSFEDVFLRVGLPYKVVGGVRFYERREVRDALAYLRTLVNPADTVSLRRILNVPKRGIGERAEAMIAAYADRERISFAEALENARDAPGIATRSLNAIEGFTRLMGELRVAAETLPPSELLELIYAETGYLKELEESPDLQEQGRAENLAELVSVAREFEDREDEGSGNALADFLEQVSLVADTDEIPDESGGVVTLMTLHAAKGLEFPVVFLTGMEDGIFPHERTLADTGELAEERRLAYVGLTRARQRLYVSRSTTRRGWGEPRYYPASRFLDDIPDALVEWRRLPEPAMAAAAQRVAPVGGFGGRRAAGPGLRPVIALDVGDRVTHSAWGLGKVVGTSGEGEKARARIDFGADVGVKELLLRYAPVEKL